MTVPQHEFLWSQNDVNACHMRRYEARDLIDKVERAGFCVEKRTSFVSLLLPIMVVSRLRKRIASGRYDPLAELRIGGLANTVLKKVLDVERALIRAGFVFPVGGSLLVIARKKVIEGGQFVDGERHGRKAT